MNLYIAITRSTSVVLSRIFYCEAGLETILENARIPSDKMQCRERCTCYTLLETVFIQYLNYIMYNCICTS